MPHRAWCVGVLIACLILPHWCHDANAERTDKAYGAKKQFDVIDVEAENRNTANLSTGETMRIVTNGDVDDAFWIKHLGEDFKHAIHLQVGETNAPPYNVDHPGPYAMMSGVGVQRAATTMPSVETKQMTPQPQSQPQHVANTTPQVHLHQYQYQQHQHQHQHHEHEHEPTAADKFNRTDRNASVESRSMQSMQHMAMGNKQYPKKYEHDTHTHTHTHRQRQRPRQRQRQQQRQQQQDKLVYRAEEYAPMHTYTLTRNKKNTPVSRNSDNDNDADAGGVGVGEHSSMVLHLPETTGKVVQVDDHQTPIVVKLPPVIYHSYATPKNATLYGNKRNGNQNDNDNDNANASANANVNTKTNSDGIAKASNGNMEQQSTQNGKSDQYAARHDYKAAPLDVYQTIESNGSGNTNRISRSSRDFFNKGL